MIAKLLILFYILSAAAALVVVKLGTSGGAPVAYIANRLQFNLNWYTMSGMVLYGVSFLLYMYLISKYDLGYIIPLTTAFVYMLIFIASFFIFKESFTALKIAGILFITLGVIFLNLKN